MPSSAGGKAEGRGERLLEIGDIVSALFPFHDPAGHEQEGHRPAVVVGCPSS